MNVHIFNICVTYEIESKEDKNRKFIDEVYQIITKLNYQIVKAHDSAHQRKDQMKAKITKKIPKLKEQAEAFAAEIMDDRLLDIETPLEAMLKEVNELDERCAVLNEKAKDINEFQMTLDMDVSSFKYVDEARVAMLHRSKLWRSLHEWSVVLVNQWKNAPFYNVDVADITVKAELFTKIALQCERNLPTTSTAVQKLKEMVF